jgi:hypothetical protein
MAQEDRTSKWKRWLNDLRDEVSQLLISREVYIEVRNIVAANPAVRTNNRLITWMTWNYVQGMLIGVRRLVDSRTDTISLVRLLREMEMHSDLLTREAHVQLYSEDDTEWQAHGTFDNLAGEGASAYPRDKLLNDRERLLVLWKKLKPLANKRIAHLDEAKNVGSLPKYQDLDDIVDEIERQVKHYCLLIEARDYVSLQPVPQYDWKAIFRVPWLSESENRRRSRPKHG